MTLSCRPTPQTGGTLGEGAKPLYLGVLLKDRQDIEGLSRA
jgi:hypothetical protein